MAEDLSTNIADSAKAPAEIEIDGQKVKSHSLKDQIEADRYLASKAAAKTRRRGVMLSKIVSPGAT